FGDFDLVEIFGGVVVDRRPEQAAQVANLVGGRQLRRMGGDVGELFLRFRRKIRFETTRHHDLPRDCLKIDGRGLRVGLWIAHNVSLSGSRTVKANMNGDVSWELPCARLCSLW